MAAVAFAGDGGGIRLQRIVLPKNPNPDELIVRMLRAPINPADLLTVEGRYLAASDRLGLGAEGVGEVTQVGAAVHDVAVGDRVLPLSRGNWATHRVVQRAQVVRARHDLPVDLSASLRINPATAWRLLHVGKTAPGTWVVQNAARSAVARWVRRLARDQGRRVVDVVRPLGGAEDSPLADQVTDGPDLVAEIAARTAGAPVTLALDCVAGEASGRMAATLAPSGVLVVFGHFSGRPCQIPSQLLTTRSLTVRGFSLRPEEAGSSNAELQALYDRLSLAAEEPEMFPPVAATFPLSQLNAALAAARDPGVLGRVLLALDA
nr:2-enoyl thioester reductase domain-containing protein [uncultured Brevundimonas sp.]